MLFADAENVRGVMPFLQENWLLLVPPVIGFVAIYLLLPKARRATPIWAGIGVALAMILGAIILVRTDTIWQESLLFYAFAGLAIGAAVMMITQKNPVHAALSFALVVLASCGLFLLQAAPFLMAATIIVYAGAIVVTFLFVIMLAQQEGPSDADQRTREPFLASVTGCILLAALLCVLNKNYGAPTTDRESLDGVVRDLALLKEAKDEAAVKEVLGDPKKAEVGKRTRPIVDKLLERFRDVRIQTEAENLQLAWGGSKMRVEEVKRSAAVLYRAVLASRDGHGSLALDRVPGKSGLQTPGHSKVHGQLPAANVEAIGKTLFTDYLVPVELAATLLLVATIGAIAISARRTEALR